MASAQAFKPIPSIIPLVALGPSGGRARRPIREVCRVPHGIQSIRELFILNSSRLISASLLGVALLAGAAQASDGSSSPICFSDNVPIQTRNWAHTVTVSKFDPDLGILTKVEFRLQGYILGSASIESLDASPITVITDFQGESGVQHLGINTSASETQSSQSVADLLLFTGPGGAPGTITLPVDAVGTSTASGSGNLATLFLTDAGASVQVCYYYELDCNGNGIADSRDVGSHGTSNDADNNGIPDECEPNIRTFCDGDGPTNGGIDCPCSNNGAPGHGCINGGGSGGLLTATGNPSVSNDSIVLTATEVPLNCHGFFLYSMTQPGGTVDALRPRHPLYLEPDPRQEGPQWWRGSRPGTSAAIGHALHPTWRQDLLAVLVPRSWWPLWFPGAQRDERH